MFVIGLILHAESNATTPSMGTVSVKIVREDYRIAELQTVVGIFLKGQEIFGKPDPELQGRDRDKFPRFFRVDGRSKEQTFEVKLPPGSYRFDILLKRSLNGCEVGGTKMNAICLPFKEDRYCPGYLFDVGSDKTTNLSVECAGGG